MNQLSVSWWRISGGLLAALAVTGLPACEAGAQSPTPQQALSYEPTQTGIDHDRPVAEEIEKCTIQPEKSGNTTSWVVRSAEGMMLRRFSDTNGDNRVDVWSYFRDGVEVYRDVDSDFNKKADQYRWLHTGGTRWANDGNEDGRIDTWRQITPYEVSEVAVQALQRGDSELFATLLPTSSEVGGLGLGKETSQRVQEGVTRAQKEFAKLASTQKLVTKDSRFLDFGASRPALVPAGTDGSTKDLVLYENVAALVDNQGKPEQLYLGTMVQVGSTWKLLGLPQAGENPAGEGAIAFGTPRSAPDAAGGGAGPSEEMQKIMTELERLDAEGERGDNKQQIARINQRVKLIGQLAELSTPGPDREQWYRQLADMLSASVQMQQNFGAIKQLEDLGKQLKAQNASEDLLAHIEFRRLWGVYGKAQLEEKDYAKVQNAWLASLEEFVTNYPRSSDAPEALLQLGMSKEFAGEEQEAIAWYKRLSDEFGNTDAGKKAAGAMRRLDSIGKPFRLQGKDARGGQFALASYQDKLVLVHYWATWCEPCKADMKKIKDLYAKHGRQGFEVVGVNLDSNSESAKRYVAQEKLAWRHVFDEGGLDGQLANDMGVMTLPLMLLVDGKGNVVNRNLHVTELESELERLLR
jgi:thiol-disulfide isomerase/thioredoxin